MPPAHNYRDYNHTTMITAYPQSAMPSRPFGSSELKAALLEPLLIVGVSAFWLVTLPFTAVALLCVKLWDALTAFSPAHPLILRRGIVQASRPGLAQDAATKRA
jgi:hypothetical protein